MVNKSLCVQTNYGPSKSWVRKKIWYEQNLVLIRFCLHKNLRSEKILVQIKFDVELFLTLNKFCVQQEAGIFFAKQIQLIYVSVDISGHCAILECIQGLPILV